MGKEYPATITPIQTQQVSQQRPIDDRFVVLTVSDLMTNATWAIDQSGTPMVYDGMIVSVVDDPDSNNNGVYMLLDSDWRNYQSWDPDGVDINQYTTYNERGWRRIGGSTLVLDKSTENDDLGYPGAFAGEGTSEDPIYVKRIYGGIVQ